MHVDADLIKACIKNKRKAQEQLYHACFNFLMPLCMRYHKNEEDARAIYNVGYMKILNNLENTDFKEIPFAAWAKRIMTNTLIDEYRKNKRYHQKISKRDNERELEYHSEGIRNKAESNFGESEIMKLLDLLKPATKQVFMLYVIEGYSHKEIGEILDMSEGTSKWHLSTARKDLRDMLNKEQKIALANIAI
ncbi:MAG: RNA polymerase sigma factor [Brumimicrobium sp.]|nr:RNA polymerase sigma factor [Brumimicrobium sp.]